MAHIQDVDIRTVELDVILGSWRGFFVRVNEKDKFRLTSTFTPGDRVQIRLYEPKPLSNGWREIFNFDSINGNKLFEENIFSNEDIFITCRNNNGGNNWITANVRDFQPNPISPDIVSVFFVRLGTGTTTQFSLEFM